MLSIDHPINGMICNRHDGTVTPQGLRIRVVGRARGHVTVNGNPADVRGNGFSAEVTLKGGKNTIHAQATDSSRTEEAHLTVLYDQNSFPRCRFSLDDNIWWLRDLARRADHYRSIFDNPFLAFWRRMHERYGLRAHFNIYYQDEADFTLEQMPDKFRSEWRDNAHWLRLTFHALANNPGNPYANADYATMKRDYEKVTAHIVRFAGEELLSDFTTIHWGIAPQEACRALRDCGIRGLVGYFLERDGKPFVAYYVTKAQQEHLCARDYWLDPDIDMIFVKHDLVVNNCPLPEITPRLDALYADKHQSEVLELMIHEQYFYPHFVAYRPDAWDRVETCARWVVEHGYKWVFYDEGFVGA